MNDAKLQLLYSNFLEFADHMCVENGPMEVAAIMMAQALTIYKSALSEDEYNVIVDNISNSRDKVKRFERPVIQ
jgi:5-bromo-4-chloroindolyl phosphate hydrolysis protein